jgi:hypothetical protein
MANMEMKTCACCGAWNGIWGWQPGAAGTKKDGTVLSPRDHRLFHILGQGWVLQGYPIIVVCDNCWTKITEKNEDVVFEYRRKKYKLTGEKIEKIANEKPA